MDFSRREFLNKIGRISLGGSAALGLPFQNEVLGAAPAKGRRLIYLYMSGGMSHIDTFDPKPGTPVQGATKVIRGKNGAMLGEYLPNVAKHMDKAALIRSLHSQEGDHGRANYLLHTSYRPLSTEVHPALAAWVLKEGGRLTSDIPGWIHVGGGHVHDSGFWGNQFAVLSLDDPTQGVPDMELPDGVKKKRFDDRMKLLNRLSKRFNQDFPHAALKDYTKTNNEALKLMFSQRGEAFDITKEKSAVRESYGMSRFGQGCLMARRLVQQGARYVEVTLGGWDHHNDIFDEGNILARTRAFDRAYGALMTDLKRTGLINQVTVVVASEFGRTPTINRNKGRDHYAQCFSALIAGAGIRGGTVYGSSDNQGRKPAENPATIGNLNATIMAALGLNPNAKTRSPTGRPFWVANKQAPIQAVLS